MQAQNFTLFTSAARTETANGDGVFINGVNLSVYLNCTAASGTSPTLDVKLQGQDPVSGEWFDTGDSFTQLTTTGSQRIEATVADSVVRGVATIGGTTPSFTFSLGATAKA